MLRCVYHFEIIPPSSVLLQQLIAPHSTVWADGLYYCTYLQICRENSRSHNNTKKNMAITTRVMHSS